MQKILMQRNLLYAETRAGRRRAFIATLLATLLPGCIRRHAVTSTADAVNRDHRPITIRVQQPDGTVKTFPVEYYIRGTIISEVPLASLSLLGARTISEVQSIIARTYVLHHRTRHFQDGFDFCSTTHCQVYRDPTANLTTHQALANESVARTTGMIVTYNGIPIDSVYHADCGGATSSATSIWGGQAPPYLDGVVDDFCRTLNRPPWTLSIGRETLRDALNGDPRTTVGRDLKTIVVTRRDNAGRALKIELNGSKKLIVSGAILRSVLGARFGFTRIKSTKFEIRGRNDYFLITGTGFGHGAGLCQTGAMARAEAGHPTKQIITAYYPGTTLSNFHELLIQSDAGEKHTAATDSIAHMNIATEVSSGPGRSQ